MRSVRFWTYFQGGSDRIVAGVGVGKVGGGQRGGTVWGPSGRRGRSRTAWGEISLWAGALQGSTVWKRAFMERSGLQATLGRHRQRDASKAAGLGGSIKVKSGERSRRSRAEQSRGNF